MAPRETENNAYAKFWGDKQRALWYVMVFSGAVNSLRSSRSKKKSTKTSLAHVDTVILSRQHLRLTSALRDRDVFVT